MVRASVEPYSNLTYVLEYVEVLERNRGLYRYGVHFDPEYSGLVIYFTIFVKSHLLTPTLSGCEYFVDITFIIQSWLLSRLLQASFTIKILLKNINHNFIDFLRKFVSLIFVENIFFLMT